MEVNFMQSVSNMRMAVGLNLTFISKYFKEEEASGRLPIY